MGEAVLLQVPSSGSRLDAVAWTREGEVPPWSTPLDPPFRLRLLAGIPQILTGPEKMEIREWETTFGFKSGGPPLALPIVADSKWLLGAVVLLNAPPFDLEDESFILAWTQYKYSLVQSWRPRRRTLAPLSEMALMRTLDGGHSFLHATLDVGLLFVACDRLRLPSARVLSLLEEQLVQLAGPHGAVTLTEDELAVFFVLPQRMEQDHLWHHVEATVTWPVGFSPQWRRKVLRTPSDLQKALGR